MTRETGSDSPSREVVANYVISERISISGNSAFHSLAELEDWPGDGTQSDPYIIENLQLQATASEDAITISSTDLFFEIRGCYFWNESMVSGRAISLVSVQNGSILDNIVTCSIGICLSECSNVTISGNQCYGGSEIGMGLGDSSHIVISDNSWRDYYTAVQVLSSDNITLSGNTFEFCQDIGLYVSGLLMGEIEGNGFQDNSGCGMQAFGLSLTLVSTNTISRNGEEGVIFVSDCHMNEISDNIFSDNSLEGLRIQYSSGNLIHNNTFTGNHGAGDTYVEEHVQAFDAYGDNLWNSSTHGNCWSDWLSPDEDTDGIVDEPYVTGPFPSSEDYGAIDYLPLTSAPTPIPEFSSILLPLVGLLVVLVALGRARKSPG